MASDDVCCYLPPLRECQCRELGYSVHICSFGRIDKLLEEQSAFDLRMGLERHLNALT